jgi:single-strand DNA-binding protein
MGANLIIVSGALVKHQLRHTPKGTPFLEVALVGKRPIGEGSVFSRTDLTFYGKLAQGWASSLQEGTAYQASGRLEYESWEREGVKASRLRIVGDSLHRLEGADVRQEDKGPLLYGAENRVLLHGGLTADSELRQTSLKTPVAKAQLGFSSWDATLAQARNHYLELEAWREVAAQFSSLHRGDQLLVEGALKTESWEDRESGVKRYKRLLEVTKLTRLALVQAHGEAKAA